MVLLIGCNDNSSTDKELTVAVAISLIDVMNDLNLAFSKEYPEILLIFSYGSSGTLQTQIEQGAPVDVFFSAGKTQMDRLVKKSLIDKNSVVDLLENKLVLIYPINSDISITTISDISKKNIKTIAIGNPTSVPLGQYTKTMLENMSLWSNVESKFNLATNARQVLTWVEINEVDCGIVYETDALLSQKVRIADYADPNTHDLISYPIGITTAAKNNKNAILFLGFLQSEMAIKLFEKYGFTYHI